MPPDQRAASDYCIRMAWPWPSSPLVAAAEAVADAISFLYPSPVGPLVASGSLSAYLGHIGFPVGSSSGALRAVPRPVRPSVCVR